MANQKQSLKAAPARILMVDDSAVVRALVSGCLRSAGYEVEEASNGAIALRALEAGSFDLVITDLKMPEMGGLAMLAQIRRRDLGPEVIILTGSLAQDINSAVSALRLGAHDYLTKPPQSPETIIFTVERALDKKRLRDENARLLDELQTLSLTDPLTGLPNRRNLDGALVHEKARALRHRQTLSVAMMDIDHFKKVNDTYGHGGGDLALKHFASIVSSTLRKGDVLYRLGGEEFVALLPATSPTDALQVCTRILWRLASSPLEIDGGPLRITASAGVACTRGIEDGTDLLGEADSALYEAKRGGRNRAILSAPRPTARLSQAS
jgi:two-component system chemotaxis family response regulator WspR